jgi:protein-disulfide isomerase
MSKRIALFALALFATLALAFGRTKPASQDAAQSGSASPANAALTAKVESYLRVLFGWGPEYKVTLGPVTASEIPEILKVPVTVSYQGHDQTGTVYVTKDAHFMFRGEIRDMSKDPFAETRAKIKLGDSPSLGPADAKLTVVEYSDFECPHCQVMYSILKQVEPEFPQVHFVFKNFPLEQLHPWAMTAALAGRCVYKTGSSSAFLKFQDSVFTNQDAITADSAWDQLTQYAVAALGTAGSADALHSCMTAPETKAAVDADEAEGKALGVDSTPTFFINGRPFVGGDRQTFEQLLRFDLSRAQSHPEK